MDRDSRLNAMVAVCVGAAAHVTLGCGTSGDPAAGETRPPYSESLTPDGHDPASKGERNVVRAGDNEVPEGFGPITVMLENDVPPDEGQAKDAPRAKRKPAKKDPEVAVSAQALIVTPLPVISWEATGSHVSVSGVSADTNVAVGPSRVVVTTRAGIAWYTKGGRRLFGPQGASSFFDLAGLGLPRGPGWYINDCRSIYDEYRGRYIVMCLYHDDAATPKGKLLVAMSRANHPEAGWFQYVINASNTAAPNAHPDDDTDYVSIGVDSQAFYTSGGVLNAGWKYNNINIVSAADMAAGLPAASLRRAAYSDWTKPDGSRADGVIQPAVHHGPTTTGYFVGRFGGNQALVWGITNPLDSATRSVRRVAVTMQPFAVPPTPLSQWPNTAATQHPWSQAIGDMPLKAEWRANKLYFVNNDTISCGAAGTRPAARFGRLDTTSFASNQVTVEKDRIFGCNTVGDPGIFEHSWPAVAVNRFGDAGIVFNRSSATSFVQLWMSAFMAADADISPSALLRLGDAIYLEPSMPPGSTVGWADVSGATVDPYDDTAIWFAGSFPTLPPSPQVAPNYGIFVGKLFGLARPDLAPTSVAGPSLIFRGFIGRYTGSFENEGDGTSPLVGGKLYLSTNTVINSGDIEIGTFLMPVLLRNGTGTFTLDRIVPLTVPPGTYFLGTCVDTSNAATEYSETNCMGNAPLPAPIQVTVR